MPFRQPLCACVFARVWSRWWHQAEERRVKPTECVTDEVEEWKERNAFAEGDATLPWVGGTRGSI